MRPDRIIVGDMREGSAALETLKSWNTGHPGGLSTINANSADDALRRIEDLIAEVSTIAVHHRSGHRPDRLFIRRTLEGRRIETLLRVTGFDRDAYRLEPMG